MKLNLVAFSILAIVIVHNSFHCKAIELPKLPKLANMPHVPQSAHELLANLKQDFNMNMKFQLKKLGINREDSGVTNETKCYGPLGCLDINENWYGLTRPVNVLPQDRNVINTQFFLRTRKEIKPHLMKVEDIETVMSSDFNPGRPTKLIVHGYIDTGHVPWIKEMSELLLLNGDFNVIAVDWGGGSAALYSQSAANTRLVGLELAHLIEFLAREFGAETKSFHVIGHSLGSHIGGYAGEKLQKKGLGLIGRISALDPAEPLFQYMPTFVRLDPNDAEFVDAIHTDAKSILMFGYGMEQPVGHVDFYPNGGSDQPGCSLMDMPFNLTAAMTTDTDRTADTVSRHLVACSHNRAIQLYIESLRLNQSCHLIGQECPNYNDFKRGRCFSCGPKNVHCALLGYRSIEYQPIVQKFGRENVKFYLKTGKSPASFCQHHYLLQLNLAQPREAERWVQGFLKVNLYGNQKEALAIDLTPEKVITNHGSQLSFPLNLNPNLGHIKGLKLHWQHRDSFLSFACLWTTCTKPKLYLKSVTLWHTKSVKLSHGAETKFLLAFPDNLGQINIINLSWQYDHELDPMNLVKVCVLLCSDHLYVNSVKVNKLEMLNENKKLYTIRQEICGDSTFGYSDVASGEWKLFYKDCKA